MAPVSSTWLKYCPLYKSNFSSNYFCYLHQRLTEWKDFLNYDLSFAYNVLSKYQSTLIADCSRGPLTFQVTYTYDIWCPMPFQPKYTIKSLDQIIIEAKNNNNFVKTLLVKALKDCLKYTISLWFIKLLPLSNIIYDSSSFAYP